MKCNKCGQEVNIDDRFCATCGAPQNQSQSGPVETPAVEYKKSAPAFVQINPEFDFASVKTAGEGKIWGIFKEDEDFMKRITEAREENEDNEFRAKMELLTNSYKVDPSITPAIYQMGVRLKWILRLVQPLDIYIKSDSDPNAFCLPTKKGNRLIMCINSSLIELMSPQELLFIMGHEVGHALLKHGKMPPVQFGNPEFSPLEFIRLRSLSRNQELSCDRIGLITCQNINAACSALFKLASGLTSKWLQFDENAYAKHFDDISGIADLTGLEAGSITHPITPLRAKALLSFSKSDGFARAIGRSSFEIPMLDMEREVEQMLSVLEPDLTELTSAEESKAADVFVLKGVLMVIAADGTVDADEIKWLKQGWQGLDINTAKSVMSQPDFIKNTVEELKGPAYILRNKLPEMKLLGLFRVIIDAALSSEAMPEAEFQVVDHLRAMLDIRTEFAEKLFRIAVEEKGESGGDNASPSVGDVVNYLDPRFDEVYEARVTDIKEDGTIVLKADDNDVVTLKANGDKYVVTSKYEKRRASISCSEIWK